jgi:hypothetical protein
MPSEILSLDANYSTLAAKLPTGRDPESTQRRKQLFKDANTDGNGYLNRAEVDGAVGKVLGSEVLVSAKHMISKAYEAAKDFSNGQNSDFVERSEFRLLLCAWLVFRSCDTRRCPLALFRWLLAGCSPRGRRDAPPQVLPARLL